MAKRYLILTFLLIPSLLTSTKDHTHGLTNSSKIEIQNQKSQPPYPGPGRDLKKHYGYYLCAVLVKALIHFIAGFVLELFKNYFVTYVIGFFLFSFILSAILAYFFEETGKVDDYSNPLPFNSRFQRLFRFILLQIVIEFFCCLREDKNGKWSFDAICNQNNFPFLSTIMISQIKYNVIFFGFIFLMETIDKIVHQEDPNH